jgi:hypothetical protein
MNQTIKENKEISKFEARFIQYSKLVLALICIIGIFYFLQDKSILLICNQ